MSNPIFHSQYTAAQIEAAIGKGPRVNANGYWEVWNIVNMAYESTGVGAGVQPPTVVTQVSQMTNHGYVYIYNGSETGYTPGYWYYWNGSAWTAGGAYQVAATDPTLSVAGAAADAKATGELKSALGTQLYDTWLSEFAVPKTNNYIHNASLWTVGQGVNTNGANMVNTKYCRTAYSGLAAPMYVCIDSNVTTAYDIFAYEYSSTSVSSALFAPRKGYSDEPILLTLKQGAKYFRIGAKRKDDANITSSDVTVLASAIKVFRFTDDQLITVGAAADAKTVGDSFAGIENEIAGCVTIRDLTYYADHSTNTSGGITYTYVGNNEWTFSGTFSELSTHNLYSSEDSVTPFIPGKRYRLYFDRSSTKILIQLYKYVGSDLVFVTEFYGNKEFTFPSDATGILMRLRVTETASGTCKLYIYDDSPVFDDIDLKLGYVRVLSSSDDLDGFGETGAYCYVASSKPSNAPSEDASGIVTIIHAFNKTGFAIQYVSTVSGKMYQRNQFTNGTWGGWVDVTAGGGGDVIQNIYNITTSPTITTDTNGWLQSVDTDSADETGKTDMTGAIMSMLTETGYCHLGEGIFYVSGNIDMPPHSMLCGCGDKTTIRLLQSVTNGYCVKMQEYCTVKDLAFSGAHSDITPTTEGTRTAIRFSANYDGSTDGPTASQTQHCMIDNIWIRNFSGSGILCHNTSINYAKGLYVSNTYIYNCHKGINIDYYSEFNKFVNVCMAWCYYACVNNGGNNVFTSCTFHARNTGFMIDGTKPNSAHGTMEGCTFCHIGSNAGKAIVISNSSNGFVISNCQVWYNSVELTSCAGVVFNGCEFGRGTTGGGATITISGGDLIQFVGCVFVNDVSYPPDITITSNTKVKFDSCYGSVSGNAITGLIA